VKARRRRGLLLLCVALACGGLAASQVAKRERSIEQRAVPVSAGGYVTAGLLDAGDGSATGGEVLARGERTVEIGVSGGGSGGAPAPEGRVDVLVSTEAGAGGGRTFVALADVELVALRGDPAGGYGDADAEGAGPSALATLRVTLRQAVYLTAADNFGREIRLLARPPGDRSGGAGEAVSAAEL
jgi:pilus assembly protein CpaB